MTRDEMLKEIRESISDGIVAEKRDGDSYYLRNLTELDIQKIADQAESNQKIDADGYFDDDPVYTAMFSYWAETSGEYSV